MYRTYSWFTVLAGLTLLALSARAGEPVQIIQPYSPSYPGPCLPCPPAGSLPGTMTAPPSTGTGQPTTPGQTTPQQPTDPGQTPSTPDSSSFAQAPETGEAGTAAPSSFNPSMFGDLIGGRRFRNIKVPVPQRRLAKGKIATQPVFADFSVVSFSANAFKIVENESPRPTNRVFTTFSFFNDVNGSINPPDFGTANLYRETLGFEMLVLDGNASVGLRLPFAQDTGRNSIIEDTIIGDLSLIFKYAFYNDRRSGDVISAGMVLTVPTGPSFEIPGQSDFHPTLFQPFGGYIFNFGDVFVQGFTSVVVPTDMRDSIILFNDFAMGLRMYQSSNPNDLITAVIPQLEVHVNTPLSHRGTDEDTLGFPDMVNLTGGVVVQLFNTATFGVAGGTPVTGPKPWAYEIASYLNFYF